MAEEDPNTMVALPPTIPEPSSISDLDLEPLPSSIPAPSFLDEAASPSALPSDIIADTSLLFAPPSTTLDPPSPTDIASITSSMIPSSPTTTSESQSSASATAAAAATPQPVLTKPQIAGVTVGSIAAAGVVFALLALFFCLRERRRRPRPDSDATFGNDKIVIDQPRTPPQPSTTSQDLESGNREVGTPEPYGYHDQAVVARPQSNRWSFWRKSMKPEDIGVAVAPGPVHQAPDPSPITPMSATSYETTSRLLPDKPTYSLFPPPLRLSSQHNGVSPIDAPTAPATSFGLPIRPAPRGRGTMDTSQMHMHLGQPTLRAVPSDPFLDASSSSRAVDPRQFQTLPAQRSTTAVPPPAVQQSGQWAQPVQLHRKPVPARLPPSLHSGHVTRPSASASELPPHPATRSIDPSTFPVPPPVRRKSSSRRNFSGKRPETFFSLTSETDFEDDDSDIEPPALQPTLSTVVESPPRRVRTAGVRYPVVPTSAAE
ncbi:MAG: hypothetical protein Q9183_005248, partial [Haloplaca sp. 2 TL-2023]